MNMYFSEKPEPSIICKIFSAMYVLFFRTSLYGHLFLSVHTVMILKSPTAKPRKMLITGILSLTMLGLLLSTVLLYAGSHLVWIPAAQMAWPSRNSTISWYAEFVLLGIDSGGAALGITISSVMTVSLIRSHINESQVKNSTKIRRSAVTVQLLTANTLFFFITWFITNVAIKMTRAFGSEKDEGDLLVRGDPLARAPKLWKSYLYWLPSLLNSVFNPLVLIVRNNIHLSAAFVSKRAP
jgi:hypothetical protein